MLRDAAHEGYLVTRTSPAPPACLLFFTREMAETYTCSEYTTYHVDNHRDARTLYNDGYHTKAEMSNGVCKVHV